MAKKYQLKDLQKIHQKLHGPNGCAWDKKQTVDDVKQFMLNETQELKAAIEVKDWDNIREELGDILHIVLFLSDVAQRQGKFSFSDVVQGICEKLVRRHPHVFGKLQLTDPDKIMELWEEIKTEEKRQKKAKITPTKAIVFDWDGVIVNSLPVLLRTCKEIEKGLGRKFYPPRLNGDHFDLEWKKRYLEWGMSEDEFTVAEQIYKQCQERYDNDIAVYPEIPEVLQQLSAHYKLAVVSNNYRSYIGNKLEQLGLAQYFTAIIGAEHPTPKPDPQVLQHCAEQLGISPAEMVFVGDMDKEIIMAKKAGVKKVIASLYGFHSKKRLSVAEPDAMITSPKELLNHV